MFGKHGSAVVCESLHGRERRGVGPTTAALQGAPHKEREREDDDATADDRNDDNGVRREPPATAIVAGENATRVFALGNGHGIG